MGRLDEIEKYVCARADTVVPRVRWEYFDWLIAHLSEAKEATNQARDVLTFAVPTDQGEQQLLRGMAMRKLDAFLAKLEASEVTVVRGNIEVTKTVTESGHPVTYMRKLEPREA